MKIAAFVSKCHGTDREPIRKQVCAPDPPLEYRKRGGFFEKCIHKAKLFGITSQSLARADHSRVSDRHSG